MAENRTHLPSPWRRAAAAAAAAAPGLLWTAAAAAAVTVYDDRRDWEIAVFDDPPPLVSFNGFTQDTSFAQFPLDVGPFSIQQQGGITFSTVNLVLVAPYEVQGIPVNTLVDGTPFVHGFVNWDNSTEVVLSFDTPVAVFGADFASAASQEMLDLVLEKQGGGEERISGPLENSGFFGFTTDPPEQIVRIRIAARTQLVGPSGEVFGMDNVGWSGGLLLPALSGPGWLVVSVLLAAIGGLAARAAPLSSCRRRRGC